MRTDSVVLLPCSTSGRKRWRDAQNVAGQIPNVQGGGGGGAGIHMCHELGGINPLPRAAGHGLGGDTASNATYTTYMA